MDPITLGVIGGAAVGSAALQWLNSKEAQEASAAERARVQALLDKVQTPSFDFSQLSPEDYKVVGTYMPQVAGFVQQAAPQLIEGQSARNLQGQKAESMALEQLLSKVRGSNDPLAEIARNRAARETSANAASNRRSLDQSFQRRGMGGTSAMQYGQALQGISDAQMADALAGEKAAEAEIARRDAAIRDAASLGGTIRGAETDIEARNAAATNQFRRDAAAAQNDYNRYVSSQYNDASKYNLGNQQSAADKNVANRNSYAVDNLNRKNQLLQQDYGNQMDKVKTNAGIANQNINAINQNAAQTNQAIQGVGEGIGKGAMYYNDQNMKDKERMAKYGS